LNQIQIFITQTGATILIFLWQAHATGNFAPQSHRLHHFEYPQFDNPSSNPSSYDYPPKQSSLEETLKELVQLTSQSLQEIIDATVANTEAIARLEGQFGHLVAEFNRIEENELQSQEMAKGQYMIDECCPSNPHHEHVQATTILGSEEIVDDTISELSLEEPKVECFTQGGDDLNLDKFLEQARTCNEPSLEDPLEKSFAQFEFDLDLNMLYEQAQALLDPTLGLRTEKGEITETSFPNPFPSKAEPLTIEKNKVEEKEEQSEPLPISKLSNDKEVSTKLIPLSQTLSRHNMNHKLHFSNVSKSHLM
jgi:hypothetical protein